MHKVRIAVLLLAALVPFYYQSTDLRHLQFRLIHTLLTIKHEFTLDQQRPNLSAQYRAFESLLDLAPLVIVDPKADPFEMAKKMRASFVFDSIIPRPNGCQMKKQMYQYDGRTVESYWVDYRHGTALWQSDQVLLYFHGGGYMVGDFQGRTC